MTAQDGRGKEKGCAGPLHPQLDLSTTSPASAEKYNLHTETWCESNTRRNAPVSLEVSRATSCSWLINRLPEVKAAGRFVWMGAART